MKWLKYPENQPEEKVMYLMYNGDLIIDGIYKVTPQGAIWLTANLELFENVTHYSDFDYPEEED